MNRNYKSSRGSAQRPDFCESILQGLGNDGGLLVADFPFNKIDINALQGLDYTDLATEIISCFTPDGTKEEVRALCAKAYRYGAFPEEVVPVKKAGSIHIAELFHGATAAFKDMALSLLPHLMTYSLKQTGEERKVMILAATSGDTGKAALEGFKDVEGTCIKVFYPVDGVSPIQKQQMITQQGNNVEVIGINGNFDDAQRAVKEAFSSPELKAMSDKHGIFLSSANSINIGRLLPQVVYYVYSYLKLVEQGVINMGEEVNFAIPSGNFGNCLAGYMAREMGLPVKRFIVASNRNNVLTDFFQTGTYDAQRPFYKTNAPAMDILVSSNLERLLYYMSNEQEVARLMEALKNDGKYTVSKDVKERIDSLFTAGWVDEEGTLSTVSSTYKRTGYLLDTHTAVGYAVVEKYQEETNDKTPVVLMATASPYKFAQSVLGAISGKEKDDSEAIETLAEETHIDIPTPLQNIFSRPVLHTKVIERNEIVNFIANAIEKQ